MIGWSAVDNSIDDSSFWLYELFYCFLDIDKDYFFDWFIDIYSLYFSFYPNLLMIFELGKEMFGLDYNLFVIFEEDNLWIEFLYQSILLFNC